LRSCARLRRLLRWHHGTEQARRAYEQSVSERPEVERLAHDLRARRSRNHFAPMIAEAFRPRPRRENE